MTEHNKPHRTHGSHWWLLLLLSTIALVALGVWWWYASTSTMARLRASGAPMSYEDLANRPVPAEGNAAALLGDIRPAIEVLPKAVVEIARAAFEAPLTNDQRQQADELLAEYADEFATLDAAAGSPHYAPLRSVERLADDQARLKDIGLARSAIRLITLRTRVTLANGQIQRAADSVIAALRLARHFEQEPFLANRLVACAVQHMALNDANRIVASGVPSEDRCQQLDAACAAIEDRSGFRETLVTERVMSIEKLAQLPIYVRFRERTGLLQVFEKAIADARVVATGADVCGPDASKVAALTASLVPALQAARAAEKRIAALARCVRIRLALREADPVVPVAAASLGLSDSTFVDPFTGGPLVIQHRSATEECEAGWWVYSLGSNQVDDGGKFEDVSDVGYAPPKRR